MAKIRRVNGVAKQTVGTNYPVPRVLLLDSITAGRDDLPHRGAAIEEALDDWIEKHIPGAIRRARAA